MTIEVYLGIVSFLQLVLLIINIYGATVKNPIDAERKNAKTTESTLNEFLIAYAGEYTDLRNKLENVKQQMEELKSETSANRELIHTLSHELQSCLFQLKALNDKLTAYIDGDI